MSGRIRSIKPEWLEDERLAAAGDDVRVLSIGLILLADDHGNGRAHPLYLASHVWPYGEAHESLTKITRGLAVLAAMGFVTVYESGGQRYFHIRNWQKHQKVQHPSGPRVPRPEEGVPVEFPPPNGSGGGSSASPALDDDDEPPPTHEPPGSGEAHEFLTPDLRSPIPITDQEGDPGEGKPGAQPKSGAAKRRAATKVSPDVAEVFAHWQSVHGHSGAVLDDKRVRRIQQRLDEGYCTADLKAALDGAKRDLFLMGQNADRKRHDGIHCLLRDAEQVERLRDLAGPGAVARYGGPKQPSLLGVDAAAHSPATSSADPELEAAARLRQRRQEQAERERAAAEAGE